MRAGANAKAAPIFTLKPIPRSTIDKRKAIALRLSAAAAGHSSTTIKQLSMLFDRSTATTSLTAADPVHPGLARWAGMARPSRGPRVGAAGPIGLHVPG